MPIERDGNYNFGDARGATIVRWILGDTMALIRSSSPDRDSHFYRVTFFGGSDDSSLLGDPKGSRLCVESLGDAIARKRGAPSDQDWNFCCVTVWGN